jgi:hypothetical protein
MRREVVAVLQLLCCLGQGDVFFHALLVQQCKVPAALKRFVEAQSAGVQAARESQHDWDKQGGAPDTGGWPVEVVLLAEKLQGAAARLREHLLNAY